MLIINADDWGRSPQETDAALTCCLAGALTSVSAMVLMQDSERAARLATDHALDVGLHLNLSQNYTSSSAPASPAHQRIVHYMNRSKFAVLLYQPALRTPFRDVYQTQLQEFVRLYGLPPSHVDGHQHRHLCANLLFHEVIPRGTRVRRNFSFWPGEKSALNRLYRRLVDQRLASRYQLTDYFFSLGRCLATNALDRVFGLARSATVELMAHPANNLEFSYLMSAEHRNRTAAVQLGTFSGAPSRTPARQPLSLA